MAAAIPVHSSKKGKQVNVEVSQEQSVGPVQPSEGQSPVTAGTPEVSPQVVQLELDLGYKLDSHQAYRKDN